MYSMKNHAWVDGMFSWTQLHLIESSETIRNPIAADNTLLYSIRLSLCIM